MDSELQKHLRWQDMSSSLSLSSKRVWLSGRPQSKSQVRGVPLLPGILSVLGAACGRHSPSPSTVMDFRIQQPGKCVNHPS